MEEMIQSVQNSIAKLKTQNIELEAVLRVNQEIASEIINELSIVIVKPFSISC